VRGLKLALLLNGSTVGFSPFYPCSPLQVLLCPVGHSYCPSRHSCTIQSKKSGCLDTDLRWFDVWHSSGNSFALRPAHEQSEQSEHKTTVPSAERPELRCSSCSGWRSATQITDIIGSQDGLGVESLRGSGLIIGDTSRAYNK